MYFCYKLYISYHLHYYCEAPMRNSLIRPKSGCVAENAVELLQ